VNNRPQVVITVHTPIPERLRQIPLDSLDEHVRVHGQNAYKRVALSREQHMNDLQDLHDLGLLAAVQAVDDDDEARTGVAEGVDGLDSVRDQVDLALQLEYEALDLAAVGVLVVAGGVGHMNTADARLGRPDQVPDDLEGGE